jgi:hypothetical protein
MRPAYKDPKTVRNVRRMTRLTEDQDDKLVRLSTRKGMTPSSYLQFLLKRAK